MFGQTSSNRGPGRRKILPGDKLKGISARFDDDDAPRPRTPKYEEFEQAPPSPWSQSPAPSPAVRADPKENTFFTDATVDEDSFNPGTTPLDYSGLPPREAIGVDNSWTVLHIPLTHALLSQSTRPFKLNAAAMDQRSHDWRKDHTETINKEATCLFPDSHHKDRAAPIAIMSILSPIIPYPSNLRHSLEHLAPHMANSFSLCRHYSNLETEITGLHRRRPSTTGFGAVAPNGRPLTSNVYLMGDLARQQSVPGSMTSPSDYSTVSRSITGSPAGTPGWDASSLSFLADKRQPLSSPVAVSLGGESYFSSKQKVSSTRQEILSSGGHSKTPSKDNSPSEKRQPRVWTTKPLQDLLDHAESLDRAGSDPEPMSVTMTSDVPAKENQLDGSTITTENPVGDQKLEPSTPHRHTMLHSCGADFASTFQSLPPSSSLLSKPPPTVPAPPRGMSYTSAVADMPSPSDRLKGLMLDSLPAHVFVALPQTGDIVWVNSRYLSYRGQTVADLAEDPWSSIHSDDCDEYLRAWSHSLRTGEQFSRTVRIKRFDGTYRWFYARAVASKDKRGVIMQFLGSYMDIHDQHVAELKAVRQEENRGLRSQASTTCKPDTANHIHCY
uniref:PAC domain-containing protein n=1 Tax=Bionectria ochroleuca TaxID=29856 RepID=A0A8H7MYK3_BIOOC